MKIQAVSATLPLLDWRVVHLPSTRLPSIDPETLGKFPFLKGFGQQSERSHIAIPWRSSDTTYFEARRAIQLPAYLPGQSSVQKTIRRVYIGGPQVRIDLAAFASLRPERLGSLSHSVAAQDWWSSAVRVREGSTWNYKPFGRALRVLADRFAGETRLGPVQPSNLRDISILQPHLLLVCFGAAAEIPSKAVRILDDPPISYFYDAKGLRSEPPAPDVSFLFIEEGTLDHSSREHFSLLRRVRRELGWLHADLQTLLEIGRATAQGDPRADKAIWRTADEIAEGLSRRDADEASGFEPLLFAAWSESRVNMLSLLRKQVAKWIKPQVSVPEWLKSDVKYGTKERQRVYNPTTYHRLEQLTNSYPVDAALQLGEIAVVDRRALDETETLEYRRERGSAFAAYCGSSAKLRKKISIIIPVRGKPFRLSMCLESIARQTLVRQRPEDVELVLIEDGPFDPANPVLRSREISAALLHPSLARVKTKRYLLKTNQGRATARNVGIFKAGMEILLFVDDSMVLEENHLAEHVIRHQRLPSKMALIGFKENLKLPEYTVESFKDVLRKLNRKPLASSDWKLSHVVTENELDTKGVFRFRHTSFREGDTVNYMELTNFLQGFSATELVGPRSLATFFQTNIVSVPRDAVLSVGGFPAQAFRDGLWGLEDSLLGALLLADGVCLVPCPTALAFKIEHEENQRERAFDLKRHRQLFDELLREHVGARNDEGSDQMKQLQREGELQAIN